MTTHEDERRILYSYPEAKALVAKKDCILGKHYHKLKTEQFILIEGECLLNGLEMVIGKIYTIEPMTYHEFDIKKDSILIGLNSKPYDPSDDYS